jgi:hypothetical protein
MSVKITMKYVNCASSKAMSVLPRNKWERKWLERMRVKNE